MTPKELYELAKTLGAENFEIEIGIYNDTDSDALVFAKKQVNIIFFVTKI